VCQVLVTDERRSDFIVADLADCTRGGRSPLVLADPTAYLDTLERKFTAISPSTAVYRLQGGLGKKKASG
jgi:hypothetical protein